MYIYIYNLYGKQGRLYRGQRIATIGFPRNELGHQSDSVIRRLRFDGAKERKKKYIKWELVANFLNRRHTDIQLSHSVRVRS